MKAWIKSGSPWIWMTSGAISLSLIAILGVVCVIAGKGLSYFWPAPVYQWQLQSHGNEGESILIGERFNRELVNAALVAEAGIEVPENDGTLERVLVKTGNRELLPLDFRWVWSHQIMSETTPADIAVIERFHNGNFYGTVETLEYNGSRYQGEELKHWLAEAVETSTAVQRQIDNLKQHDIGRINYELEQLRLAQRKFELSTHMASSMPDFAMRQHQLDQEYQQIEQRLAKLYTQAQRGHLQVRDMRGELITIELEAIVQVHFPNAMTLADKLRHWASEVLSFLTESPRESNTEGGVYPAIFGTVFMVMLMAVIVTPFGVLAAVYLHEYAGKGIITQFIRIAVINLAGVPSIVYGVFGLGFFVYVIGGSIDSLFYSEALPTPTFGSPGVLWSALTLAILTLPVVIVSTEEGLSRIPTSVRHGSLALGATQWETLWRVILPMATPAIMTGLILAVARAAGEVAPLMLVGVVKLAPVLPVDGNFPFVHLERQFMHLGFHIYDVGFQSPNVEAVRPLVYATSFLLVTVILTLNLTAIGVRNSIRERYRRLDY